MIDTELSTIFSDIATSIRGKGVEGTFKPDEMSQAIDRIPSGQEPVQDDWYLPYGWIDLRDIIKNDPFKNTTGVIGRCAVLILVDDDGTVPLLAKDKNGTVYQGHINGSMYTSNMIGVRTSDDPSTYITVPKSSYTVPLTWNEDNYIRNPHNGERYVWIEMYFSTRNCVTSSTNYAYWRGTLWICGDDYSQCRFYMRFIRTLQAITNFDSCYYDGNGSAAMTYLYEDNRLKTFPKIYAPNAPNFQSLFDNTDLKKIEFKEGGFPVNCTNWSTTLHNCFSLTDFPDILFEGNVVTNINNVTVNCYALTRYPDVMDFRSLTTNKDKCWNQVSNLRQYIQKLPSRTLWPDVSAITIAQMGSINENTLARFDDNGNLIGGWFYGWEKHPNQQALTITLQYSIAGNILNCAQAQKDAIVNHLATKGITLVGL